MNPRLCGGVAHVGERGLAVELGHDDDPATAVPPEDQLEQPLGDALVRPDEVASRSRARAAFLAEVDGDSSAPSSTPACSTAVATRMLNRELRGGLADDLEQRARPVELALGFPRAVTLRAAPPKREARTSSGLAMSRRVRFLVEDELEHADRRLAEPQRSRTSAPPIRSRVRKFRESSTTRAAESAADSAAGESPATATRRGSSPSARQSSTASAPDASAASRGHVIGCARRRRRRRRGPSPTRPRVRPFDSSSPSTGAGSAWRTRRELARGKLGEQPAPLGERRAVAENRQRAEGLALVLERRAEGEGELVDRSSSPTAMRDPASSAASEGERRVDRPRVQLVSVRRDEADDRNVGARTLQPPRPRTRRELRCASRTAQRRLQRRARAARRSARPGTRSAPRKSG